MRTREQRTAESTVKKYIMHPGWVLSHRDGDRHYVRGADLIRLYKLDPAECIVAWQPADLHGIDVNAYTHLYPDPSGRYALRDACT